jgi:hypothetical protein
MKTHQSIKNATIVPTRAVQKHRVEVIDQGTVDEEDWYVVQVEPIVSPWIREQQNELWYEHKKGNFRVLDTFDIHTKLYTMLVLRWS